MCSSSNSRRTSSRSASPPTFSPQSRRKDAAASLSTKRGGLGRGRGRGRARHLQMSVSGSNVENKQPVGKRGGRKSLASRLGASAKKKR